MENRTIDILMITYKRSEYTRLSLSNLLDTCDETMRVWIWHNGNDLSTLEVIHSMSSHPRFHKLHVDPENKKLNEPTNWLWANATGQYVSKVDDDCLLPRDWANILRQAHQDVPQFGVIGCWRFPEEDFVLELAKKKIKEFPGGHRLLMNCFIEGSGYLMKRSIVEQHGLLNPKDSFSSYCIKIASKGFVNGWYFPFIPQEHMDDPRSPHTQLKTEEDFKNNIPLTAKNFNILTRADWIDWIRQDAIRQQKSSLDPAYYKSWRRRMRKLSRFIKTSIFRK